jgi:phosphoglycerate dehydrogenase-like enzyme
VRPNVVLIGAMYDPDAEKLLEQHTTVSRVDDTADLATLGPVLAGAHGLAVRYPARITAEVLAAAPNLLAILSSGRGVDNIDIDAASAAGVVVANNPGLGGKPVSEHALGLLLMIARDLPAVCRDGMAGAWDKRLTTRRVELDGNVLGIVGCGNVGSTVARRASAGFNMRVLAYDPYVPAERMREVDATKVNDFGELLAAADFVTAHPELNTETERMFDDEAFRLMKPGSYFVNTSRGRVVDTDALVRALRGGHLAGAALDVYDEEPPPPNSPLLTLDNLVLTAHVADFTVETKRALAMSAANQLLAAMRGEQPPHLLNPQVWEQVARRHAALA